MPLTYIHGDATAPSGNGARILVHVCNDIGGWGRGFVTAVSKRWPTPEARYREWHRRPETEEMPFQLGEIQFVTVEAGLTVANLIGQHDIRPHLGLPPIRYDAVRQGLEKVAKRALAEGASVHMPRIGCGLAGGKWELILPIIESELVAKGVSVTVYDF